MKYHFDFLPTKFELVTRNTEISPFLYNRVGSISVDRTSILTRDLKVKMIGIRSMAPVLNTGPLEGI